MAPAVATYEPHDPSRTVLYKVIAEHLETFLASLDADPAATGLPAYVQLTFRTLFRTSETILEEPPVKRGAGAIYRLFHAL